MADFGHWLVTDWHWLWLVFGFVLVWAWFLKDVVEKFLNHRKAMKDKDVEIQRLRVEEARLKNQNFSQD